MRYNIIIDDYTTITNFNFLELEIYKKSIYKIIQKKVNKKHKDKFHA